MTRTQYLKVIALSGLALFGTACATQEEGADGEQVASKRECRSFSSPGTKMKESVCRTAEQWAIIDAGEAERQGREGLVDEFFRRAGEAGAFSEGQGFDNPNGL